MPPMHKRYIDQVERMLQILSLVMGEKAFALKGGTAINFFVRDVPRLSVDIDLSYTPVQDRLTTLAGISAALVRIREKLLSHFSGCTITDKRVTGGYCIKLFVNFDSSMVIVEPNTILRGTIYPPLNIQISPALKDAPGGDDAYGNRSVAGSGARGEGKIRAHRSAAAATSSTRSL
jgi:hypothetical protein